MSRAAVSQHLTVLEQAGLVTRVRRGQWIDCHLTPAALAPAAAWLEDQRAEWTDRLDRLDAHLSEHPPFSAHQPDRPRRRAMIDTTKGFTIVRTFTASPEQVWHAWLDPQCIAAWWHPAGAITPRDSVEVDARVGGHYRYTMINQENGTTVTTGGVYRELTEHSRLSFTWGEPDADPDDTPIVTITLEPEGEGTRMTFDLRGVDGNPGDGYFYDGWLATLDSLAGFLD